MFAGPQLTTIPNIWNDLQCDHVSVKEKGEKRFLEAAAANIAHRLCKQSQLWSHTPEASSSHTAAHLSRPRYQLAPPGPASSPRPLLQAKRQKITPITSSPISISSSSPSPLRVLELTESDGDAPLITPVTHGPSQPFVNVKEEAHDASVGKSPCRWHTSTPVEKKWPSDYYVVDVAYVLDACKVPHLARWFPRFLNPSSPANLYNLLTMMPRVGGMSLVRKTVTFSRVWGAQPKAFGLCLLLVFLGRMLLYMLHINVKHDRLVRSKVTAPEEKVKTFCQRKHQMPSIYYD